MKTLKKGLKTVFAVSLIFGLVALVGCGQQKDGKPWAVQERCVKGVVYYVSGYQLAPAFKQDGTLYTCEGN